MVIWGGGRLDPRPSPDEVVAVYRVGLHQLQRDDSPRFIAIPESPRPVVQIPLGNDLIHAPTGAVLFQLRWLGLEGRHDPVDKLGATRVRLEVGPNIRVVRTYQERPQSHLDWHARPSVRMLIVGSEPVSIEAIDKFNGAFAPHSLPPNSVQTLVWQRRGDAVRVDHRPPMLRRRSCTSTVPNLPPAGQCLSQRMPRVRWRTCRAGRWPAVVGRSSSIQRPRTGVPDRRVGDIWLHGDNVGRG